METRGLQRKYKSGGATAPGTNDHFASGHRLMRCAHNGIRYFDLMDDRERELAERAIAKERQVEAREKARQARANPIPKQGFLRRLWRRISGERAA